MAGTLEDLGETTETMEIWPMAGSYQENLAERPTPITVNTQTEISKANPSLRIR